MANTNNPKPDPEDVRTEYTAVADYHSAQVGVRFTVAGFYIAAMGFLAQSALFTGASGRIRIAVSTLGCLISVCVWILELRSRALYRNLAHRGMDIEHYYWGIEGPDWYKGFFNRQYKEPPPESYSRCFEVPKDPSPDCPMIAWLRRPLPPGLSKYITHSMAFDILYPGSFLFWLTLFVVTLYRAISQA